MYMGEARNEMLEALFKGIKPAANAEWVGLYTKSGEKTGAGWTQASQSILKFTAHGFSTGNLVCVEAVTGATGNALVAGRFYYVKEVNANELELSETSTFLKVTWTGTVTNATVSKYTEVSGAPYVRLKSKWDAAGAVTASVIDDKEAHKIAAAESTAVDAVSIHTLETAGALRCIERVTHEVVTSTKEYVVTDQKMVLLGSLA